MTRLSVDDALTRFSRVLASSVADGRVDYARLKADPDFAATIEWFAGEVPLDDPRTRLAYFINAYNAFALLGVTEGLNATSFLRRKQFFSLRRWPICGAQRSLNQVEHDILRKLGEPRIHFAINCASVSCPALQSEAFMPDGLEAQLDGVARAFVNDPRRNRFDAASRTAHLSQIFNWFETDFRASAPSVAAYVSRYVADARIAEALARGEWRTTFLDYDWTLNGEL